MRKNIKKNKNNGFSLIEILLAISIFALVVMGTISSILYSEESQVNAGIKNQAVIVAEETLEIVRSIKNQVFSDSAPNCMEVMCEVIKTAEGDWVLFNINSQPHSPQTYYDSNSGFYRGILMRPMINNPIDGRDLVIKVSKEDITDDNNILVTLNSHITNWKNGIGSLSTVNSYLQEIQAIVGQFYSDNSTYLGAFEQDAVSQYASSLAQITGNNLMENVTNDVYAFYILYQGSYYCMQSSIDSPDDLVSQPYDSPPSGTVCGE